ncbi:MAG TPA: hypothetical protein VFN67_35690 [Polyangiales bacterium]|nr:hypothetical protein [Polyangiales bacterium]
MSEKTCRYACSAWLGLAGFVGCSTESQQTSPAASAGAASQSPRDNTAVGSAGTQAADPAKSKPETEGGSTAKPASSPAQVPEKAGTGGAASSSSPSAGTGGSTSGAAGSMSSNAEPFSFFVTSYAALQRLSKSPDGFGGDLRYGEADGLAGADRICRELAEASLPGAGDKTWRAFLSVTKGADGMPVHAIDRIGNGPWYDRLGRLLAMTREDILNIRPKGGDPAIVDDFPNEDGVPNHAPDGVMQVDNHDVLTGTNDKGQLFNADWKYTCHDWTSAVGADGTPRVGHSWPRSGTPIRRGGAGAGGAGDVPTGMRRPRPSAAGMGGGMMGGMISGDNWMSALNEAGCAPGASLVEMGGPRADNPTVGSGGGYGAIYCFALTP